MRSIASTHNVAVNTVVKAFKALEQRGLIRAGRGSGYRVRDAAGGREAAKSKGEAASRYQARGVSATKHEVHAAVDRLGEMQDPRRRVVW